MVASMDEMCLLVDDSHLSSVILTNNSTKTSYSRLGFICVPPKEERMTETSSELQCYATHALSS
jgi:hypothetical protein